MDSYLSIILFTDLPSLSKYQWWTLFGIMGLIIGMLPAEKTLYLKRVLLILCLGWIIIYLQVRYNGYRDPLDIFIDYSLPQLLFFLIPYRLADYLIKSELFKKLTTWKLCCSGRNFYCFSDINIFLEVIF